MMLWRMRDQRVEMFEEAVANQLVCKIAPDGSELGKIRKAALDLSNLGVDLGRSLNLASDCKVRIGFENVRLIADSDSSTRLLNFLLGHPRRPKFHL